MSSEAKAENGLQDNMQIHTEQEDATAKTPSDVRDSNPYRPQITPGYMEQWEEQVNTEFQTFQTAFSFPLPRLARIKIQTRKRDNPGIVSNRFCCST